MKGKFAFVLGAAVGYVLGSRAGRQRYEQIKRGAERVWSTALVQKGVASVQGAIADRADELRGVIRRASVGAIRNFARQTAPSERSRTPGDASGEAAGAATAADPQQGTAAHRKAKA